MLEKKVNLHSFSGQNSSRLSTELSMLVQHTAITQYDFNFLRLKDLRKRKAHEKNSYKKSNS